LVAAFIATNISVDGITGIALMAAFFAAWLFGG
jgi:hypothetical protein